MLQPVGIATMTAIAGMAETEIHVQPGWHTCAGL